MQEFLEKILNLGKHQGQQLDECLEKWKEEERKMEDLKEKIIEDRNRFKELTKHKRQRLILSSDLSNDAALTQTIEKENKPEANNEDSNKNDVNSKSNLLSRLLTTSFKGIFQTSTDNAKAIVIFEIKEIQKNVNEDLETIKEALCQLDSDKDAEIARLSADIEKLRENIHKCKNH